MAKKRTLKDKKAQSASMALTEIVSEEIFDHPKSAEPKHKLTVNDLDIQDVVQRHDLERNKFGEMVPVTYRFRIYAVNIDNRSQKLSHALAVGVDNPNHKVAIYSRDLQETVKYHGNGEHKEVQTLPPIYERV